MQHHNFKSFINKGLREWTTWLGSGILMFGLLYYKEINKLIENILTSPKLAENIIDGIAALSAFLFILYKQRN